MNAGMIIGWGIVTMCALIMAGLGLFQYRQTEKPVGFYNVIDPPKKEAIMDVIRWNKAHGMIWILYGICIEVCFLLAAVMPNEALEMLLMMGGIVFPLPLMILRHHQLEKKYKKD